VRVAALAIAGGLALGGSACSDDGSGSAEELCAVLDGGRSFGTLFEGGLDPTDTERSLEQLRVAHVDLEQLRDAAPSEVRDDLEVELDYVESLIEVLETVDPDDPAAVVAAVNALADQRGAVEAAAIELRAFQTDNC
jgi:hypothetical protein